MSEINSNKEVKKTEYFDEYNNYVGTGVDEEYIKTKTKYVSDENKRLRYTKPAIVRLEYKTRYNSSKIVKNYLIKILIKN